MNHVKRWSLPVFLVSVFFFIAGCSQQQGVETPPVSMAEYVCLDNSTGAAASRRTVVLFNLQRVTDSDLAEDERIYSMNLIWELYSGEREIIKSLSMVANSQTEPQRLRKTIKNFLDVIESREKIVSRKQLAINQ